MSRGSSERVKFGGVLFGTNVGFEEDGKNDLHERPVLVIRKYNSHLFMVCVDVDPKRRCLLSQDNNR
jgi:hypothetical protein